MIAYIDSSVLARAYLVDEPGHDDAMRLLDDAGIALVTGTWTRIEVSGALVRASRSHREASGFLSVLDGDFGPQGRVAVLRVEQDAVEDTALALVRGHGIRAADAWHLAVAQLTLPRHAEANEVMAFATRDSRQARVAGLLGLLAI